MVKREYMTKVNGKINVGKKHQAKIPSLLNVSDSHNSYRHTSSEQKHSKGCLHANTKYATTKTAVTYKTNIIKKASKEKNHIKNNNNNNIKSINTIKNVNNLKNYNKVKNLKRTESKHTTKVKTPQKDEENNENEMLIDAFSNSTDFISYESGNDEGIDVFHEGLSDYLGNEYKEDTDEEQIQNFLLVENGSTKKK